MKAVTLRLPQDAERQAEELASREDKPLAPFLRELVLEGIRMRRVPGAIFTGPPTRRRASVAGIGLDVWELISLYRAYDEDRGRLLGDFPHVEPRHLEAALAYWRSYPDEIEEMIRRNERPIEEWVREYPFIHPA